MKRNKKPVFLTDVDGCGLDWVRWFGELAQTKGHKLQMEHPQTWEMNEWFNASSEEIEKLIKEFNGSESFAKIPVFEDAKKILPLLAQKYDLVAITCCSKDPLTIARREENLKMLDVKFKEIHCLDFSESKVDLLKAYHPTFWVEDRFEGAKAGVETGHQSLLINRSYNQHDHHDEIIRVNDWYDIYKQAVKEIKKIG